MPYPGPRWMTRTIIPPQGTVSQPIELFYRDPMEAVRHLLSRPDFTEHMDFIPKRVYTDSDESERLYSEMSTGDWWWRVQVCFLRLPLPPFLI